jgi:hypothetical protein
MGKHSVINAGRLAILRENFVKEAVISSRSEYDISKKGRLGAVLKFSSRGCFFLEEDS